MKPLWCSARRAGARARAARRAQRARPRTDHQCGSRSGTTAPTAHPTRASSRRGNVTTNPTTSAASMPGAAMVVAARRRAASEKMGRSTSRGTSGELMKDRLTCVRDACAVTPGAASSTATRHAPNHQRLRISKLPRRRRRGSDRSWLGMGPPGIQTENATLTWSRQVEGGAARPLPPPPPFPPLDWRVPACRWFVSRRFASPAFGARGAVVALFFSCASSFFGRLCGLLFFVRSQFRTVASSLSLLLSAEYRRTESLSLQY